MSESTFLRTADLQKLLAAIVESSDDAIISKNLDSTITSWNKGAERIFGYTAEEIIGQSITVLIPEERIDEEALILGRIRRGERLEHFETIRQTKDGRLLNVSLTVSPVRNAAGTIVGASKIARDITPQRLIQEALRHSEGQYRVTLESIGDAVITTDEKGAIVFLNSVAEELTGWPFADAAGQPLETVFHIVNEVTRQLVESPVAKVIATGGIVGLANHTVLIARDGTERPIDDSGAPIRDGEGQLAGVVLVFRDVTQQRASEMAARRLAAIVEGSEDGIISKNLDGTIVSWNQSAERILGYSAAEAIGQPITMLLPADRLDEEVQIIAQLVEGKRVHHFETIRRAKDGRLIDVSLSISPVRDGTGRVVGASKILRDVTDRKRVESELRKAREALQSRADDLEEKVRERTMRLQEMVAELEAFSYSISHDLRAPLRAIQQYSEILKEDYAAKVDEQGRVYLNRIANSVVRLDALIRDVLTYSRVVRSEIAARPVDTQHLVEEVMEAYPNFKPPAADIRVESPLLPVKAHEPFLVQCLSNLIGNAIKFVRPGQTPHVVVRTEARGDHVRIWVEDNGIGIDPKNQARIFGMFERAQPDQLYEGTGIGLSIVRKAVERMDGTLGVESGIGHGSRFWIELPRAD